MIEKFLIDAIGGLCTLIDSFSRPQRDLKNLNKLWISQGSLLAFGLRIVYDELLFDRFYNAPYEDELYHVKLVHDQDNETWYCLSNKRRDLSCMEELSIFLADGVCRYLAQLQNQYAGDVGNSLQLKADEMTVSLVDPGSFRSALVKRMYRNAVGMDDTLHQDWYKERIKHVRQTSHYKSKIHPPGEE